MGKYRELTPVEQERADNLLKAWNANKKRMGLTQESAAHIFGCTQGNIGHYLHGRIPLNTDAVLKFAAMLEVPASDIDPSMGDKFKSAAPKPDSVSTASDAFELLAPMLENLSEKEIAKLSGQIDRYYDQKMKEQS